MTTALYLLRAYQCGISAGDMDKMSIGMIMDIFIEKTNDTYEYDYIATQADIDKL